MKISGPCGGRSITPLTSPAGADCLCRLNTHSALGWLACLWRGCPGDRRLDGGDPDVRRTVGCPARAWLTRRASTIGANLLWGRALPGPRLGCGVGHGRLKLDRVTRLRRRRMRFAARGQHERKRDQKQRDAAMAFHNTSPNLKSGRLQARSLPLARSRSGPSRPLRIGLGHLATGVFQFRPRSAKPPHFVGIPGGLLRGTPAFS